METQQTNGVGKLERFERKVVFRAGRAYFLILAGLGMLALLAGLMGVLGGVLRMPVDKPAEPPPVGAKKPDPPDVTPPTPVALAEAERWAAQKKAEEAQEKARAATHPTQEAPSAISAPPRPRRRPPARRGSSWRERRKKLLARLAALLPVPPYASTDTYKTVCLRQVKDIGCMEQGRELDKVGTTTLIRQATRGLRRDVKLEVLGQIVAVLEKAPVEKRGDLIAGVSATYRQKQGNYLRARADRAEAIARAEAEHQEKTRARAAAIAKTRMEYEQKTMEQKLSQAAWLSFGIYAAVMGFGLLVLVSLFLAHLAIERHLRLLRELLAGQDGRNKQVSQEPAAPRSEVDTAVASAGNS